MRFFTREIKIGLSAIVAIAIVYGGMIFLKGMSVLDNDNIYYLKMKNVSGLAPQSEVLMYGMKIGIVKDIQYRPDYQDIIVKIEIDEEYTIAKGATAGLAKEMLGTTRVSINMPETINEPYAKGDTIIGKTTNDLMASAADMVPQIQAMLPKMDSILTSINALASNPALSNSLNNIEYLTGDLRTTTTRLNQILGNDVPQLIARTNNICGNLETTTSNLSQVDFLALSNNVNSTMGELQSFTHKLNNPSSSLGLLLNDNLLYNNLNSTFSNASLLLEDFRLHPKRYVHFSLFGKKDK